MSDLSRRLDRLETRHGAEGAGGLLFVLVDATWSATDVSALAGDDPAKTANVIARHVGRRPRPTDHVVIIEREPDEA